MQTTFSSKPPPLHSLSLITDRLRLLVTRRAEMWWDIGELLDDVALRGVAHEAGYADFAVYARKVAGIELADARRLRRVAHHFSREVALRFGADKLDLLLKFLDASPESCWALDPLTIQIPTREGNPAGSIPFSECSLEDLRQAARSARQQKTSLDASVVEDIACARDELDESLAKLNAKNPPRAKILRGLDHPLNQSIALHGIVPSNMEAVGKLLVRQARALQRATARSRRADS